MCESNKYMMRVHVQYTYTRNVCNPLVYFYGFLKTFLPKHQQSRAAHRGTRAHSTMEIGNGADI